MKLLVIMVENIIVKYIISVKWRGRFCIVIIAVGFRIVVFIISIGLIENGKSTMRRLRAAIFTVHLLLLNIRSRTRCLALQELNKPLQVLYLGLELVYELLFHFHRIYDLIYRFRDRLRDKFPQNIKEYYRLLDISRCRLPFSDHHCSVCLNSPTGSWSFLLARRL